MRTFYAITAALAAILVFGACGSQGVEVESETEEAGAELFVNRCAGCHTLEAAGALGSGTRVVRNQGPNLDERIISEEDVLYAIRNGGFSGVLMPQQIVTGEDAEAVAEFVSKYAGTAVDRPTRPSPEPGSEVEPGSAAEDQATGDAQQE